jgi:hypothetical protein
MKAIHLTAYGNPAQNLRMVEVSEPNAPSASEALVRMSPFISMDCASGRPRILHRGGCGQEE